MNKLALVVLLAGCGDHDCSIDALFSEHVDKAGYTDCGHFTSDQTASVLGAAHTCVLDATRNRRSFAVRWQLRGIEGVDRRAYIGTTRGTEYELVKLRQGYEVDGTLLPTETNRCSGLSEPAICNLATDLCFECIVIDVVTCEP